MMNRPVSRICMVLIVALLAAGGLTMFTTDARGQWSFAQKNPGPEKESPTVEVEIETPKDQGDAPEGKPLTKVRVKVDGKESTVNGAVAPDGPHLLPKPDESLAPVETERIEKAGEEVGKRIEELAESAPTQLGRLLKAKAFSGISWFKLCITLVAVGLVLILGRLMLLAIDWRIQRLRLKTKPQPWKIMFLDALGKPLLLFAYVYGIYFAVSPLLPHFRNPFGESPIREAISTAADVGGTIAVIWFIYRLILLVDERMKSLAESPTSRVDRAMADIVSRTIRIVVVIIGGIVVVQNLTGIHAGPILASLGIGGLAVALAAKEPLTNIFGTFTILFDKPYRVGHRVVIDGYDGMVEHVGYRSTRIRTWDGYLVSIPNQKILTANLENIAERPFIRWAADINLPYDTPPHKVKRAVCIIREVLESHGRQYEPWPPWVYFTGFQEWSLNIMVRAYFETPDLQDYYEWLQDVCLDIMDRFDAEGIRFAFPTNTTFLAGDESREMKLHMLQGLPPDAHAQPQTQPEARPYTRQAG